MFLEKAAQARPLILGVAAGFVSLLLTLPGLGAADFLGDDEALDAGVVWEMAEHGHWVFPEFNGEVLPPKPPLFYWLAGIASRFHGQVDEWSVRLPSALLAAATVTLTVVCGASLVGRGPAFLGGLLLAVMPTFHGQARIGRSDMTMTVLVAAILFLFHLAPQPFSRGVRWLFFVLAGLTLIAKGAAGCGLVVVVLALDAFLGDRRQALRSLWDPAIAAFLIVGGSWYLAGAAHWGPEFVERHIIGENARHFFGGLVTRKPAVRGIAHHLTHFVNIFTGTFPWGFLLPLSLRDLWRTPADIRSQALSFLGRWALGGFVFFTVATRKSPYYLLPILPPVALLVGNSIWERIAFTPGATPLRHLVSRRTTAAALAAALLLVLGWLLVEASGPSGTAAAVLEAARRSPLLLGISVAASSLLITAAARAWAAGDSRSLLEFGWLTMLALLTIANLVDGPLARRQSLKPFAREIEKQVEPGERLFFFKLPLPAVALYTGRRIPTLVSRPFSEPEPFYLVVPDSLRGELPEDWKARSREVARADARVFTRKRMGLGLLRVTSGEAGEAGAEETSREPG